MTPTARSQISAATRWPTVLPLVKPEGEVCAGAREMGVNAYVR